MLPAHVWRRNGVDPHTWDPPKLPGDVVVDVFEEHAPGCTCGPREATTCRVVDVVAKITKSPVTSEIEAAMASWLRGEQDGVR